MIKIIPWDNIQEWNSVLKSFPRYDVYYMREYVAAFKIHGDGEPLLIYYNSQNLRAVKVVMKRRIELADVSFLQTGFYDLISPYGYGGFIFDGDVSKEILKQLLLEYNHILNNNNIISEFTRFHPLLDNSSSIKETIPVIELGKTISMDLSSEENIWNNISSKNRNMIRKAQKNGIVINNGLSKDLMAEFIAIYNATMERDYASDYYFFKEEFYQSVLDNLKDNCKIFYATLEGKIIAMSIILYANSYMHYHLSGSLFEYRQFAPSNLLLYEAALWGYQQGFKVFHLGGGIGSGEDNLFKFKQAFNKNSSHTFAIGKYIYNQEIYDRLVNAKKDTDPDFDENSNFFPLYRA